MTIINERKYFVKAKDKFNLESMHTHLQCLLMEGYREENGFLSLNEKEENKLTKYLDEVSALMEHALYGKVNAKEYGRILEISQERQFIRYQSCSNASMSHEKAAHSFE